MDIALTRQAIATLRQRLFQLRANPDMMNAAVTLFRGFFSLQRILMHAALKTEGGGPWCLLGVAEMLKFGDVICDMHGELRELLKDALGVEPTD